ncbi:MAG TPA: carbohydrate kinase family protein [Candidatus Nanoarchaeia archaeon]|nr:carbohydrate kinase family protein [Candidatus Nanoarchaeia archaeon]
MFLCSMIMKYDFIAVGGAVEDITFYTEEGVMIDNKDDLLKQKLVGFELGAKIRVEDISRFPGGGANNAAVCLARLGFKAALLAAVGEDETGKKLIKNLAENGVDTRLVKVLRGEETGFSFVVINKNREHVIFVYRGANSSLEVLPLEAELMRYSKWLYVASLSGKWEKVLDKVFGVKDALVAWNPGNVQLAAGAGRLRKYMKNTAVFMVNKDEAIELALSAGKNKNKGRSFFNDIKNLLLALKDLGPAGVLITDGARGADFYDGEIFYHQNSLRVPEAKIADTTGVGDSFCATFIAGLEMYEGDYEKAMKLAMKNSAANLREAGAQNGLLSIKN